MRSALIFDSEIKADADHRVISDNLDAAVKVTSNGIESDRVKAKINITFPDKTQSQFVALDNGEAVDAKKSDAIYTAKQVIEYQQLGLHVIESDVDISYLGETYTLKNMKNIWVTENLASIESVEIITDSAQQGCIQEVKLIADIDIKKAGHYKLLGMLEGSKNRYYGSSHELFDGQVGFQQIEIKYPKKDLLSSFSKEDVISFVPLRVLKMDHENQYNTGYNAYVNRLTPIENRFKLADLNFCREDIEVAKDFVIEEEKLLGKTKISALQLTFDVAVNHSGLYGYSVNFRHEGYVSSFGGRYHESQLEEGDNQVVINIDANRLKEFKGGEVKAYFSIWEKNKGARLDKKLSKTIRTYQSSDFSEK